MLLQSGGAPPLPLDIYDRSPAEWLPAALHWLASVGKPLLVGLPLLALLLAITGYFFVHWTWRMYVRCAWQRRRRARRGAAP